ncbi:MAG: homocysteine S-methyltransferase family protein [Roseburia sp.]|nr:homocysteine S-methyltransferase family protein [Roseburia sp.]MCM1097329.1 homocysteine S-methyltransferase family protein [Ruminococcus flavefaciens]
MTRDEFQRLSQGYLYLDGATGSNLVKAGMPSGVCPEKWILEHREVMLGLQKRYVAAGSDILYAPTFTANRIKLAEYGLERELADMNARLTAISREAASSADRPVFVAGDLTMTGRQLRPVGDLTLEELIDVYQEQITALSRAGADLLVVETMMSLGEARAALIAAKEVCELPVMVTMTFEGDGRTLYGTDAETAAVVLESLGACAVGVNCSAGPGAMREIVAAMAGATAIPIIAKPNAGLPFLDHQGKTCYSMDAPEFVEEMGALAEAGATILGGCCGTDPEFIEGLRRRFGREVPVPVTRRRPGTRFLASERKTLRFGLDGRFLLVGERINPTGKKLLQAELREGRTDRILEMAETQERDGAEILDVNLGMSGIDEKQMMLRVVEEIGGVTSLPLSLDSSHVDVLEAALRQYPGRALVNSVSMEKEKLEKLLPLVKKYGAMFILLPLSDEGLPKDLPDRIRMIEGILESARACGLGAEDVVVDGLVATVGANERAALETLETIRYCREKGLATICGLSNISFGMPERCFVNAAFLTMAIREGLTMAISNPSQELLVSCALASDLLLAKRDAAIRYIEYTGAKAEERERTEERRRKEAAERERIEEERRSKEAADIGKEALTDREKGTQPDSPQRQALQNAVLKGNRNGIAALTMEALAQGENPAELLNEVLLPAINQVGDLYDRGKYFLPQLIAGAEAMKNAIEVLEPLLLRETAAADMPVIVIATVEGDIHDIGKNLVALMLKNNGFRVVDLGKDVPAEEIVRAAEEHRAQIIALSALMTTTMQRMREVVARARERGCAAKIMIGGAVITREYAEEIGADGYSADAAEAVRVARELTGL